MILTLGNDNIENSFLRRRDHRLVETVAATQSLPITGSNNDVQEHLDSIAGYADEPLLPLVEACAPLVNIIHDLLAYVYSVLDETSSEPADGLTLDESAAICLYTIGWEEPYARLYSMLNTALKEADRQALRSYFKYLKLFLAALVKLPCAPLQTIWRGINHDLSDDFHLELRSHGGPFHHERLHSPYLKIISI